MEISNCFLLNTTLLYAQYLTRAILLFRIFGFCWFFLFVCFGFFFPQTGSDVVPAGLEDDPLVTLGLYTHHLLYIVMGIQPELHAHQANILINRTHISPALRISNLFILTNP